MKAISTNEKNDVLLVLALAFQNKFAESAAADESETIRQLAEKSFGALNGDEFANLRSRAALLDELPPEKRRLWQEILLEKLRRRGRTTRLDENINPTQIVKHLARETKTVQRLILKNLPADLSRQIAENLQTDFADEEISLPIEKKISDEIVALVKRKFLANFTALEDIYEPRVIDKFSVAELEEFIHHLTLREIAAACRGINSKEMLAAFLSRFDENAARQIAFYITELEKIRPFWVAQAGELVRQSWSEGQPSERLLKLLGLKLLAIAFAERDAAAQKYAAQKLSTDDAEMWLKFVAENEEILTSANDEERLIIEKRQKFIGLLAAKFNETGRL